MRCVLFLLVLLAAVPAAADPALEREARAIEHLLIAPCCFTQQVSVHHSPAADAVRADIRARLGAGQTRDEILQAYVGQYGTRILAEPPARGFSRFLHVMPPIAFVLTLAITVVALRRFTRARGARVVTRPSSGMSADDSYEAELDDQLRDLD